MNIATTAIPFTKPHILALIAEGMNGPRIIEELGGEKVATVHLNGSGVAFEHLATGETIDATLAFDNQPN